VRTMGMRSSLLAAAAVAMLVALVVGAVGILRTSSVADRAEAIYTESLQPLNTLKDIEQLIWHGLSGLTNADPVKAKGYTTESDETYDVVSSRVKEYDAMPVGAAAKAGMAVFAADWAKYMELRQQSADLKAAGKLVEWQNFRSTTLNPALATALTQLQGLITLSQKSAAATAAKARSAARQARDVIGAALVIGLLVAAVFSVAVARALTRRLAALQGVLSAMAAGDLSEHEPDNARNEIGDMSRSVHHAVHAFRTAMQTLSVMSTGLAGRSTDLKRASRDLSGSTDQTSSRVGAIDTAAGEVTAGVQAVAGGAEEMGAAIREIAISATEAAQVAQSAVRSAAEAEELMVRLDASSAEIDSVVKAITAIAEQTNLLALNATIEAARAGESGKGFAVVAGEVKDLAQETATATEEISRRTEAIQADSRVAVTSIIAIGQVIQKINDYQNTIASAVEQQSATTSGMTGELGRAASGSSEISSQLRAVVAVTESTRDAARATEATAAELADISGQLDTMIGAFRF